MEELKKDLYTYLNIDTQSEEVALFNTNNKVIEDIYFTNDSLILKINNNTINYLNGATSIKDINKIKGKRILTKAHIEYIDDFIIYKYKIEDLTEEFQIRCLKATLTKSIKDKNVLQFYTYSMFFRKIKDISINQSKELILSIELIDGNVKEYKLKNAKLKDKNNYLKGYFKNELEDFNISYKNNYKFYCHIYKENKYIPLLLEFDSIEIIK